CSSAAQPHPAPAGRAPFRRRCVSCGVGRRGARPPTAYRPWPLPPVMPVFEEIKRIHPDMTSWRRDIHAHPEMAFEERRTSGLVAHQLAAWGIDVHTGLADTGVVGVLKVGTSGRSIGLRADMDALPIQEETGL